jgi:hypothetical protein
MLPNKIQIVSINSQKATKILNQYGTALMVQFDQIASDSDEILFYSIQSAVIPYSWYGVNHNNKVLDIDEYDISGNINHRTIILSEGNYSASEYVSSLLGILNSNINFQYDIKYSKINNKFQFRILTLNCHAIFLFKSGSNSDVNNNTFLGFSKDIDVEINNHGVVGGMVSMSNIYHINLKSDIAQSNILTGDGADDLFEIIPINTSPLSFIQFNPVEPVKYRLNASSINCIKISLEDNNGYELNLNGMPWIVNIRIETIKDPTQQPQPREPEPETEQEQTALERIQENPNIISKAEPDPLNDQSYKEYNIITQMLNDLLNDKNNI